MDEWRENVEMTLIQSSNWLLGVFLFSTVWSVGATLDSNGRVAFDKFFRTLVSGMNDAYARPKSIKISKQTNFPDRSTVYDFLFSKVGNGTWDDWSSLVVRKEFPASMRLGEMIIPNANTIQQNYFLKTLCFRVRKNFF